MVSSWKSTSSRLMPQRIVELPPLVRLTVQRILQEAVANVIRHASAGAECRLALRQDEANIEVTVSNRVRAADAAPSRSVTSGGMGLASLAERVSLLSGTLTTGVEHDDWVVRANLPLTTQS
ncbi:sensor histidine kinase [Micropruina sp.]|uniref:sensor histidine kinase n=1 Tax=Micropruina sp. TaxID=2737536 RepID=UPI0039E4774F